MKRIFSTILVWSSLLLCHMWSTNTNAQSTYNLSITQTISNDTLYLDLYAARKVSASAFAFGNSDFLINIDTSIFDISKAIIAGGGLWDNNSSYGNLSLAFSNQYQFLSLSIVKKLGLGLLGVNLSTTSSPIGKLGIPVKKCTTISNASWRQTAPLGAITEWLLGTNIRDKAQFFNPPTLASLCDGSTSAQMITLPNDSVCKGDTVTFVASISSVYDDISFYQNGTLVQSGTSNAYKLINPSNGVIIRAEARRCNCKSVTTPTQIFVDDFKPDLGPDQQLCNKQITLDAGAVPTGVKYQWNTGGTNRTIPITSPGTYSATVYRPGGCVKKDDIVIKAKPVMGIPYVTIASVTATSIQFKWDPDMNAIKYEFSTDSISWGANSTFSQTLTGLAPLSSRCGWVRFISTCDTIVSQRACATTLGNCTITYKKTNDTAVCGGNTVTLKLSNINPPNSQIRWMSNPPGSATTFTVPVKDTTIYFAVIDPSFTAGSGCFKVDSIKVFRLINTTAKWSGLKPDYCTSSYTSILIPNQPGGVFSGPGVAYNSVSNQWYFKPSVAGPGTHTITYKICNLSESQTTVVAPAPCVTSLVTDSTSSAIAKPEGIFTDCKGQIYLSSSDIQAIVLIDTLGNANIVAGDSNLAGYKDGPVATALINKPFGIQVGPDGTIYFVDGQNQSVRMVKNGVMTTIAGFPPGATAPKSGDAPLSGSVAGTSALFKDPFGLALSADYTKLFVSDYNNRKIKAISLTPPYNVTWIAGFGTGTGGLPISTAGVPALSAALISPRHISADSRYIYITDEIRNSVYAYEFSSGLVKLYAGSNSSIPSNTTGFDTDIPAPGFFSPFGASVACNGDLYIADKNNNSIKLVDQSTYSPNKYISNFAGANDPAVLDDVDGSSSVARFRRPTAVSVFVKGFIDVADTENNKIKRISIQDYNLKPWTSLQQDFVYCTKDKADTLINPPCGGSYSGPGIVYSGGRIIFNPALAGPGNHTLSYTFTSGYCTETMTQLVRVYRNPDPNLNPQDTLVCANQFGGYQLDAGNGYSTYKWYHKAGNSFVVDNSSVIRYFNIKTVGTYVVEVTDNSGCKGFDTLLVKSKPVPVVSITSTEDTLCYGGSTLLTANATITGNNAITNYLWNTGSSGSTQFVDVTGNYIVTVTATNGCSEKAKYRLIERNAPIVCMTASTMAGIDMGYGLYGKSTFAGNGASGKGALANIPALWDVYFDKNGKYLYLTEEGSLNDVKRIRLSDTIMTSFIGATSPGAFVDSVPLLNAKFNHPYGIVELANGKFFIADRFNQVIRSVDTVGNKVRTMAGYPLIFGSTDGKDTSARFYDPFDMTSDVFGNIYVTDYSNHLIRKITSQGQVTTLAGDSYPGVKNGVSTKAEFAFPVGIEMDVEGNLFVTDANTTLGNTLRKITMDTVVSTFATGFNNPWNIVIDKTGNVFVSDIGSGSIKKVSKTGVVTTIATGLITPRGITIDPLTEKIYVAERGANKITTLAKNKNVSICQGDSIKINATCSGAIAYQWTPAVGLSSTTTANPIAFPQTSTKYYLRVVDRFGCTNVDSIYINVITKPIASAGIDRKICKNDSVKIGAALVPGLAYKWAPSTGLNKDTLADPFAKPVSTQQYILTVTSKSSGCKSKDTVNVTVYPAPTATAGNDKIICFGDSVLIGGASASGNTYAWTPNLGLNKSNISNPKASPATTTTYILTVTSGIGCIGKDTVIVTVNPKPIALAGTDTTMCLGGSKKLGVASTGNYNYSWSPTTRLTPSGSVSNPVANPTATTTYIVTVTNPVTGCFNKDTTLITVNPLPAAVAGPDKVICEQDQVTIGVAGVAGNTYSWTSATGLSNAAIANPKANPVLTTTYALLVVNATTNCSNKDTVIVTVNPKPLASFTTSNVCAQDTVSFTNSSSVASGSFSNSWNFGDPASGVRNTSTTANPNHFYSANGSYVVSLITTSNLGCKDTATATIAPLVKPNAGFTDIVPCATGPVQFNDTTSNVASRTWNFGDPTSTLNTSILVSDVHTYVGTAPYSVTLIVTGNNACKDTVVKTISPDYMKAVVGNDTTICLNTSASLKVSTTGGNPAYTYAWTGTGTISNSASANTIVSGFATPGNYPFTVTVSDVAGCSMQKTMNVIVNPLPLTDTGADTLKLCFGKSIILGGNPTATSASGIKSYVWSPSIYLNDNTIANPVSTPLKDTTYYLTVTDNNKCVSKDSVRVKINPLPNVSISQSRARGCTGSDVVLSVNASNSGNNVAWSNITTGNSTVIGNGGSVNVSSEGTYKVVIVNPVTGCTDSATKFVDYINPPASLSLITPTVNCINTAINLSALASGDSLKYKWSASGLGSFIDSLKANPRYIADPSDVSPLTITVEVSNSCDTLTGTGSVVLNPAPVGSFTYSPLENFAFDTITFTNTSDTILYNIKKWGWDFKDGSTDSSFHTTHVFTLPGIYNVSLTVINDLGCSYTYVLPVDLNNTRVVYIPNVFSPNAVNPENRTVKVYGVNVSSSDFQFSIYDRWGVLVFETNNFNEANKIGWDGTNMSKEAQSMGVYTYSVKFKWADGTPVNKTGTITLVR